MQKRTLGTNGLEGSAIGLGCMSMTGGYSDRPDQKEMIALIRTAVDRGETYRGQVVIATKFGWDIDPVERKSRGGVTSNPEVVRKAVDGSLQRLGVEVIDLYFQHRVDPKADRGCCRRRQGADRSGQGQTLRHVGGGGRDHSQSARGSAGDCGAE
jgi:aryl-alcohol dehydrogenase-like predicted oxidoreductase